MLANCVVEGNVVVGTLATRALCNMPLSERLPESGSIAHVRAQWFITSTFLTQVLAAGSVSSIEFSVRHRGFK
jgi:hypothetical protein